MAGCWPDIARNRAGPMRNVQALSWSGARMPPAGWVHFFFALNFMWACRLRMKSKMIFIQMVEPAMADQVA